MGSNLTDNSASVNHAPISSWNQPVLSNKGKVSCSGFELTTVKHPYITSQAGCFLQPYCSVLVNSRNAFERYIHKDKQYRLFHSGTKIKTNPNQTYEYVMISLLFCFFVTTICIEGAFVAFANLPCGLKDGIICIAIYFKEFIL